MVKLKCWEKDAGWESPGWYNEKFFTKSKKTKVQEIIMSAGGKHEGTNKKDTEWVVGFYDEDGQPINSQKNFPNKNKASTFVNKYMKNHDRC